MPDYGGSVAERPKRLLRYTKADRDTILAKYRRLQEIHANEHAEVKALKALLLEALPNLADYVIMVSDRPDSLWQRIFAATCQTKAQRPTSSTRRKATAHKAG